MRPLAPVASHAEGSCARALLLLDSYLDGELSVETIHELLAHLERCAACGRESRAREALRAAVRRVAARDPIPDPAVTERIRAAIAGARPRRPAVSWTPLLLAAAVVLAAAIAFPRTRGREEERALRTAESTQVHCALGLAWPEGAPALASLQAEAGPGLAPLLPKLAEGLSGWSIVAAHRCVQEGEPVLHVILRRPGERGAASLASLVVVPVREGAAKAWSVTEREGFTLVGEAGRRGTAFVVTSGPREEAVALGRRALPILRPLAA